MPKRAAMIALIASIVPIMAVACPPLQQNPAEKDRIHADLLAAENEMRGRAIGGQLWRIWTTAPDEAAQDMLDRGRERIRLADYETAESYSQRILDSFHAAIFSPRVDLSRIDINSLDGSNRVTRNPLDMLLTP